MYEVDKDILTVLTTVRPITHNEIFKKLGGKYTLFVVREGVKRLTATKFVKELRASPRRFVYRKLNKREKAKIRK